MKVSDTVPKFKHLQVGKIKTKTAQMYETAVQNFEKWSHSCGRRSKDHKSVDIAMSLYIQELCEEGRCITEASYTVYGWILLRSCEHLEPRSQLPFSKQALKGWRTKFPGRSKSGVDLKLWDLIALKCCEQNNYLTAAGIIVQGDSYLRPCELLSISSQHLIPPSASRAKGVWGAIVGLEEWGEPTKAKEFDDCILFNTACRMDVNHVISILAKRKLTPMQSVFHPLTSNSYGRQIQQAVESLKLEALDLTPHILRHSGASHDAYYEIRDIKQIQLRGRWKCLESVKRYRKPGRMLLTHKHVSASVWKKASCSRDLVIRQLVKQLGKI